MPATMSAEDDISDTEPNLDWWDRRLPNVHGTDTATGTRQTNAQPKRIRPDKRTQRATEVKEKETKGRHTSLSYKDNGCGGQYGEDNLFGKTVSSKSSPDQRSNESDTTTPLRDCAVISASNGSPEFEAMFDGNDDTDQEPNKTWNSPVSTPFTNTYLDQADIQPSTEHEPGVVNVSQTKESLASLARVQYNGLDGMANNSQHDSADQDMDDGSSSYQPSEEANGLTHMNSAMNSDSLAHDAAEADGDSLDGNDNMLGQDTESSIIPLPKELLDSGPDSLIFPRKRPIQLNASRQLHIDPEYARILRGEPHRLKPAPVKGQTSSKTMDSEYLKILQRHAKPPVNAIREQPALPKSAEAEELAQRYRAEIEKSQHQQSRKSQLAGGAATNKRRNTGTSTSQSLTRGHMEARIQGQRDTGTLTFTHSHSPDSFTFEPSDFPLLNIGVKTCSEEPAVWVKVSRRMLVGDILKTALQDDDVLRNHAFMVFDRFVHFHDTPAQLELEDGECFEMHALPREWLPASKLGRVPTAEVQRAELPNSEHDIDLDSENLDAWEGVHSRGAQSTVESVKRGVKRLLGEAVFAEEDE